MTRKRILVKQRNWLFIFVALLLIIIGGTLAILSFMHWQQLGWFSPLVALVGLSTITGAVMSLVKNDPTWILLHLVLPG